MPSGKKEKAIKWQHTNVKKTEKNRHKKKK